MITIGKTQVEKYMTLMYNFAGTRIFNSTLIPVNWELKIKLVALGKKNMPPEKQEELANTAYKRIYFWLDTNLPNIIMVNSENDDDMLIANIASNMMMYIPGEPSDDLIIQLLHAKLNSIANDNMYIGEIELKGSDTTAAFSFECSDKEYDLPHTISEYVNGTSYFEIPWWFRNDGHCYEFIKNSDENFTFEELYGKITDPMEEFDKAVSNIDLYLEPIEKEPAKIIKIEKWVPRKV
jgi:hypothetical protein